jgi:type VI secretion system protein
VNRGLLDRIAEEEPSYHQDADPAALVREHLRVLLNTRRGGAPSAPEYGVIDLADLVHEFPAGSGTLQQAIWETISIYEPRLTNVSVSQLASGNDLLLRFEITGVITAKNRSEQGFRVSTQVHASGHVDLS